MLKLNIEEEDKSLNKVALRRFIGNSARSTALYSICFYIFQRVNNVDLSMRNTSNSPANL